MIGLFIKTYAGRRPQRMDRRSVYPWGTVCNINYLENLVWVIQRFMPPSVHSRADEIYNLNFNCWNTLGMNVGNFFLNHVKTLGTQWIIWDRRKPEAKVIFCYAYCSHTVIPLVLVTFLLNVPWFLIWAVGQFYNILHYLSSLNNKRIINHVLMLRISK